MTGSEYERFADDAVLVASEFATGAVQAGGDRMRVTVEVAVRLRVTVECGRRPSLMDAPDGTGAKLGWGLVHRVGGQSGGTQSPEGEALWWEATH